MGTKWALTGRSGSLNETCSRTSPAETTRRKGESKAALDLLELERLQPRGHYEPQARMEHPE